MTEDIRFPNIASFAIRIVQDHPIQQDGKVIYRGSIRHIQTDSEITFTQWPEAMAFIHNFIPIGQHENHKQTQWSKE